MKRILLAIVAGAFVTVPGYFLLTSVVLPSNSDSTLLSDAVLDDAGRDAKITPQMRAKVLLQEHQMQELQCVPIEAHVQELVDKSRDCKTDTDCVVVSLGCPFACVGADEKSAASPIIEEEESYQAQCHSCI